MLGNIQDIGLYRKYTGNAGKLSPMIIYVMKIEQIIIIDLACPCVYEQLFPCQLTLFS